MNDDRPQARPRRRATAAADEIGGATPIEPLVSPPAAVPTPSVRPAAVPQASQPRTFVQLNVRITGGDQAMLDEIMRLTGRNKVNAVRFAIQEAHRTLR